jgi:hypothetical protein
MNYSNNPENKQPIARNRNQDKLTEFAALLTLHQSQQKKGDFNSAILDEAKKILNLMEEDSPERIEVLRELIAAFRKAGCHDEAESLSQQLNNNPVVKTEELRELAAVLVAAGDIFILDAVEIFIEAEEFARLIKHTETKVKALRELAAVLAQTRYIQKAWALLEECEMLS